MPVYDHLCKCGKTFEAIMPMDRETAVCPECGEQAKRIISCSGQNCANEDAEWIRSVLEVVDKDSNAPHVKRFLKEPTRSNYKAWMRGEGIRPLEPGEERRRPSRIDDRMMTDKIMRMRQERRRLEIG